MCDAHWRIVMLTWHQINVIWLHFIVESQNNVIARREREREFLYNEPIVASASTTVLLDL